MDLIKRKFILHSFVIFSLFCEEIFCVLICYSLFGVGYELNDTGFETRQVPGLFLFYKTARPWLGPTKPHFQ
jgi:hypothetical protein